MSTNQAGAFVRVDPAVHRHAVAAGRADEQAVRAALSAVDPALHESLRADPDLGPFVSP